MSEEKEKQISLKRNNEKTQNLTTKNYNDSPSSSNKSNDPMLRQLAKELHAPARKKFKQYRPVKSFGVNDLWHADLLDVSNIAGSNKGRKWILTVIDVFSKVGYARGLKTKSAHEVANAFEDILETNKKELEAVYNHILHAKTAKMTKKE